MGHYRTYESRTVTSAFQPESDVGSRNVRNAVLNSRGRICCSRHALAERGEDGAPNDGVPAEALARHELVVQVRQSIKRDTWIPVMLDVVADIARQDEDRLDQGGIQYGDGIKDDPTSPPTTPGAKKTSTGQSPQQSRPILQRLQQALWQVRAQIVL